MDFYMPISAKTVTLPSAYPCSELQLLELKSPWLLSQTAESSDP